MEKKITVINFNTIALNDQTTMSGKMRSHAK